MADTVLLVTRDEWMRTLLVPVLQESRFDPQLAPSAGEAIQLLKARAPAAVVIDAGLRGDEASEIVSRVRKDVDLSTIPIVVICHADDADTRVELLDAGADACVIKPFRSDEVGAALRALLRAVERVRTKSVDDAWDTEQPIRASLEGDLSEIALASVLSMLEMERRSGELVVIGTKQTAKMLLAAGTAVHARLGDAEVSPIAVARKLLRWKTGRFTFHTHASHGDMGRESIGAILLEAARLEDEDAPSSRQSDGPPSARQSEHPTIRPEAPPPSRKSKRPPPLVPAAATTVTRRVEPPRPPPPIVTKITAPRPPPPVTVKMPGKG